jgi:hypothetical protein
MVCILIFIKKDKNFGVTAGSTGGPSLKDKLNMLDVNICLLF